MQIRPGAAFLSLLAFCAFPAKMSAEGAYSLQTGDVVFQSTAGEQAEAVRAATGSRYTHCGLVFEQNGEFKVLEASQPVKITPFEEFRKRSQPGSFQVRRLKQPLSPAGIEAGKAWAVKQVGLNYDLQFRWDDGKMYCSELVWKAYKKAGVELCPTKRFSDYKLDAPEVKELAKKRFGSAGNLPQEEPVVSPGDLADSPLLVEVPAEKS